MLELEANCHTNWLVISQDSGGYDRRAQDSAQIPDHIQYIHLHNRIVGTRSKSQTKTTENIFVSLLMSELDDKLDK